MPDPSLKGKLTDIELVEYAQRVAGENHRSLRHVKDDTRRDSKVVEDRSTGERRTLPNKFIRAIGQDATFELVGLDRTDLVP